MQIKNKRRKCKRLRKMRGLLLAGDSSHSQSNHCWLEFTVVFQYQWTSTQNVTLLQRYKNANIKKKIGLVEKDTCDIWLVVFWGEKIKLRSVIISSLNALWCAGCERVPPFCLLPLNSRAGGGGSKSGGQKGKGRIYNIKIYQYLNMYGKSLYLKNLMVKSPYAIKRDNLLI